MKISKKLKKLSWLFFLFLAAIVCTKDLGIAKNLFGLIDKIPLGDKIGHFVMMGTLVLLVNLSLKCEKILLGNFWIQKGLVIVMPIVLLEEFSQILIISRQFSMGDILADVLGLMFFSFLSLKIFKNPVLHTAVS